MIVLIAHVMLCTKLRPVEELRHPASVAGVDGCAPYRLAELATPALPAMSRGWHTRARHAVRAS